MTEAQQLWLKQKQQEAWLRNQKYRTSDYLQSQSIEEANRMTEINKMLENQKKEQQWFEAGFNGEKKEPVMQGNNNTSAYAPSIVKPQNTTYTQEVTGNAAMPSIAKPQNTTYTQAPSNADMIKPDPGIGISTKPFVPQDNIDRSNYRTNDSDYASVSKLQASRPDGYYPAGVSGSVAASNRASSYNPDLPNSNQAAKPRRNLPI